MILFWEFMNEHALVTFYTLMAAIFIEKLFEFSRFEIWPPKNATKKIKDYAKKHKYHKAFPNAFHSKKTYLRPILIMAYLFAQVILVMPLYFIFTFRSELHPVFFNSSLYFLTWFLGVLMPAAVYALFNGFSEYVYLKKENERQVKYIDQSLLNERLTKGFAGGLSLVVYIILIIYFYTCYVFL